MSVLPDPPPHPRRRGEGGLENSAFTPEAGFVFTDHEPVIDTPAEYPQLVLATSEEAEAGHQWGGEDHRTGPDGTPDRPNPKRAVW